MLRLREDDLLFPNGKKKALTFSFDDGIKQDEKFIDILNKYKMKATFNLNSGLCGNDDWLSQENLEVSHHKFKLNEIAKIYKEHEIACHTLTHLNLTKVPINTMIYEVNSDKYNLEKELRKPIRGLAYPFGAFNETTKKALEFCDIVYARTTEDSREFGIPECLLKWHPTCHYNDEKIFSLIKQFGQPDEEIKLFSIWGHTYEFEGRKHWDKIEHILEKLFQIDDVWYATNMEIATYLIAYKQLVYSASGDYIYNPTCLPIWIQVDNKRLCVNSGETIEINI